MNYFKKILRYAYPYKKLAFLNIFFNILYALFSTLSFVALIPVLEIIFSEKRDPIARPVYEGLSSAKDFAQEYLNYFIIENINNHGEFKVLMGMVGIIIGLFLLKNLSNYMAMFYSTFMKAALCTSQSLELERLF